MGNLILESFEKTFMEWFQSRFKDLHFPLTEEEVRLVAAAAFIAGVREGFDHPEKRFVL